MSHYETLDITATATPDDIKKAFRQLARDTHPDHHPGDPLKEERFKAITAAYEVLSDPAARKRYDAKLAFENMKERWRTAQEEHARQAPAPSPPPATPSPAPPKEENTSVWGLLFGLGVAAFALHKMSQASDTQWDSNVERNRGPDGRFRPS
ncbi:molecular chaperone DnaJ [Melittangium boletus DSM 14713]|uniref:Molecular chaperone DnaJ n=2 Tax=Melittangium boletus TaxID=83453 RepID=A0A250IPR0_9BACT|nr:molecular chaperone DnaJ [Melittangium boletus DSM 14713]